ncbi:MAG: sensor domain-containing diguanylate cyclase [Polyangiaceae bacterium]|nr:sensor domain-containing diguanylate cyclase [Polyangiaceae bacterium]
MSASTVGDRIGGPRSTGSDSAFDSPQVMCANTSEHDEYFVVFHRLPTPVILLDERGTIRSLNHEALKLALGSSPEDALARRERAGGELPACSVRGCALRACFPWLPETNGLLANQAEGRRFECTLQDEQGQRCFDGHVLRLSGSTGEPTGSVIVLDDVTEHRALVERLDRLARTDCLTETNNRRRFRELAQQETLRAWRYSRNLSVLAIDVDHFKEVNDRYGHATGDELLVELAHTMSATLRVSDTLARMGGEEFAILLPETDNESAVAAAGRVLARVGQLIVHTLNGPLCATVSIGVATLTARDRSLDDLLNRADTAMYRAKALGRNCVVAAPSGCGALDASSAARLRINASGPVPGPGGNADRRRAPP